MIIHPDETAPDDKLSQGVAALKASKKTEAQQLLMDVVQQSPEDVEAWLWLGAAVSTPGETLYCLQRVLELAPDNQKALSGIKWAKSQSERGEIEEIDPFLAVRDAQLAETPSNEANSVKSVEAKIDNVFLQNQDISDVSLSQRDSVPLVESSHNFFPNLIIAALAVVLLLGILIIIALVSAWLG